jgi:hypothetical protein
MTTTPCVCTFRRKGCRVSLSSPSSSVTVGSVEMAIEACESERARLGRVEVGDRPVGRDRASRSPGARTQMQSATLSRMGTYRETQRRKARMALDSDQVACHCSRSTSYLRLILKSRMSSQDPCGTIAHHETWQFI